MIHTASQARKRLGEFASPTYAKNVKWFFKVNIGGYSENDHFIGVRVPKTRIVAKEFRDLSLKGLEALLKSRIHEERLLALIILVNRAKKSKDKAELKQLTQFYLKHIKQVDNWDLVDVSAEHLLGKYLFFYNSPTQQFRSLAKMAKSQDLWTKRIAMIATFYFVRRGETRLTFKIALILLHDKHDLIQKAVGWMLREAGKRKLAKLVSFLKKHYRNMPRTALRYAIEKFPQSQRQKYLSGNI